MRARYDLLFLSPHLDDAVLSCGGYIFEAVASGASVLLVTIAAGDPPTGPLSSLAHRQHDHWGTGSNGMVVRRSEDRAACESLGADALHLGVPDAIYRTGSAPGHMYATRDGLFGELRDEELSRVIALAEEFSRLPQSGSVLCPLAVGGHVDHQLTRAAAERWWGRSLRYYEDYPYVAQPGALQRALGDAAGWFSEVVPLSPRAQKAKVTAIREYATQVRSSAVELHVLAWMARTGGERLWRRSGPMPEES